MFAPNLKSYNCRNLFYIVILYSSITSYEYTVLRKVSAYNKEYETYFVRTELFFPYTRKIAYAAFSAI